MVLGLSSGASTITMLVEENGQTTVASPSLWVSNDSIDTAVHFIVQLRPTGTSIRQIWMNQGEKDDIVPIF